MKLQDKGVYSLYDANWDEVIDTICDNVDWTECSVLKGLGTFAQPTSVQDLQYWMQLGLTDGFYEPVTVEQWAAGDRIGAEIDVSKIKSVPMTFIMGGWDTICPAEFALEFALKIPVEVETITIDYRSHFYFGDHAYTEYLMDKLLD